MAERTSYRWPAPGQEATGGFDTRGLVEHAWRTEAERTTWWHYTCIHARNEIGETGMLRPIRDLVSQAKLDRLVPSLRHVSRFVWLTDLDTPDRRALGLTMQLGGCDRAAYRYRVHGDYTPIRYVDVRRDLPERTREQLESAPGAMPAHWWVAVTPVPVVLDQNGGAL